MFKSIVNFFKNIFFPKVKEFISNVFTKAVQMATQEVMDVARIVVRELNYETLTSTQKRNEAYKRVVEALKESGKEVSESIIRTTIEMAYLEFKNSLPPEEEDEE